MCMNERMSVCMNDLDHTCFCGPKRAASFTCRVSAQAAQEKSTPLSFPESPAITAWAHDSDPDVTKMIAVPVTMPSTAGGGCGKQFIIAWVSPLYIEPFGFIPLDDILVLIANLAQNLDLVTKNLGQVVVILTRRE